MISLRYFFCILFFLPVSCQINFLFGFEYIFDFPNNKLENQEWIVNIPSHTEIDYNEIVNKKYPLLIANDKKSDFPAFKTPLSISFFRQIAVPSTLNDKDTVTISIHSKTLNLSEAQLKIFCLDINDNIIYSDSMDMNNNENTWNTNFLSFHSNTIEKIVLGVYALGYDLPSEKAVESQKLWIDKIILQINGHQSLPDNQIKIEEKINSAYSIELTNPICESFSELDIFKDKTIIGIGEAVHGSKTINELTIECLKNLIINQSCRLVLFELNMFQLMTWNRFIQGKTPEEYIYEIKKELLSTLFSPEIIGNFLLWLRNYNNQTNEKIVIHGLMDYKYGWENYLFDYIFTFYNDTTALMISPILKAIDLRGTNLSDALTYAKKEKAQLDKIMGSQEYINFLYALERAVLNNVNNNHTNRLNKFIHDFQHRDKAMAKNVQRLVSLYIKNQQKAVIVAHNGHINKKISLINFPDIYSMGYYLDKEFGNKYYALGIFPGEGSLLLPDKENSTVAKEIDLRPPLSSCLEYSCLQHESSIFFYPAKNIHNTCIYFRNIGNVYLEEEYESGNISKRMDGFIFVDKIKPIHSDSYDLFQIEQNNIMEKMKKHINILHTIQNK
jgi:erythromycin esterase-like protein